MKRLLFVFVLVCAAAHPVHAAGGTCPSSANYPPAAEMGGTSGATLASLGISSCYFIAANGSDSNNGTSESTPWAHMPGMPSCTSTCASVTPAAGTGFIFRGGDTWGSANFAFTWNHAGASGSPIYIGVDQSWFSGGSWARPIWTCNAIVNCGTAGATDFIEFIQPYNIFDNIEITGFNSSDATAIDGLVGIAAHDVTVEELYAHGWQHTPSTWIYTATNKGNLANGVVVQCCFGIANTSNIHIRYNYADGSDEPGGPDFMEFVYSEMPKVYGNYIHELWTGMVGPSDTIHDNFIDTLIEPATAKSTCPQGGNGCSFHQDGIYNECLLGNQSAITIYNNVIRGVNWVDSNGANAGGAIKLWLAGNVGGCNATGYAFNNVLYNNYPAEIWGTGRINAGQPSYGTWYIFQNTTACGTDTLGYGGGCGLGTNGNGSTGINPMTLNVQNNHWIYASSSVNNCSGVCVFNQTGPDVIQTIATANAQGYNTANGFRPTAATDATVTTAGASDSANCAAVTAVNAVAGAACLKSTTFACSVNTSNHTVNCPAIQPITQSTTKPNIGAYVYTSGGSSPPQPSITCNGQSSFNFGSITVNSTGSATCTLSNSGSVSLNVSTSIPANSGFSIVTGSTCGTTLAAGQSCTIPIQFAPTAAQAYSSTLTETDSTNNVSASEALSGTGIAPASFTLSPSPIFFGNQSEGVQSSALTVALTNSGGSSTTLPSATCPGASCFYQITGANAGDFATVAPSAPTWTLTQHKIGSCATSNTTGGTFTCTGTLGSNITAGHSVVALLAVWNGHTGSYPTTPTHNATTGDSDTWQTCPTSIQSIFHVTTGLPYQMVLFCDWVPSATGGGNTVTMSYSTQSGSGIYIAQDIEIVEFVPSSGSVAIDKGNTIASPPISCSSCSGPSLTIAGTSDFVLVWSADDDTTYSGSPINSPYTLLDTDNSNVQASFAYATNQASVTTPVWTMSGTGNWTGSALAFTSNAVSNACSPGQTLAAGASCNVQLIFTPSTSSSETATFAVSGSGGITGTSSLLGTGVGTPQAATPVFSPAGGTYTSTQTPSMTSSTSGSTIIYTTDGSQPTTTTGCTPGGTGTAVSNGSTISVSATATVKAIACHSGDINSGIATAVYTIQAAMSTAALPTTSLASGSYVGTQSATLSSGTSGATICYRVDGGTPTAGTPGTCDASSTSLTNGHSVSITTSEPLSFIATQSGFINSGVVNANYTLYAGAPTFSPNGGLYAGVTSLTVTVTSSTGGTIWYTTDLSTPTCSHGTSIASGQTIPVTLPEVVFAVTCQSGLMNSGVAGAVYTPYVPAPAVAFAMLKEPSLLRMP